MAVIKDVAKMAGLSVSVVSKYLNYPDTVREDTRSRIEAAIEALDYVPSTAARSMRTKHSKMIAIVVADIQDEFFAEIFSWMKESAASRGYTPMLFTTEYDDDALMNYLGKMSISHFDGIIPCFIGEDKLPSWTTETHKNFPIVMLNGITASSKYPRVMIDLDEAEYEATKHLAEQGYKKIAFIGGGKDSESTTLKFNGFARALKDESLPLLEEYMIYGKTRYREGYLAAKKLLSMESPPDAVVTANDAMAAGFIKYALTHGIRVPEDVGIIGFDDIPMAALYEPGISTVAIPVEKMCRTAMDMLIDCIENTDDTRESVVYRSGLITRRSTDRCHTLYDESDDLFAE